MWPAGQRVPPRGILRALHDQDRAAHRAALVQLEEVHAERHGRRGRGRNEHPPPPVRVTHAQLPGVTVERSQYFPGALRAFPDLTHRDALSVLAITPEPGAAARLTMTQIRSALRRGGRTRNVERRAAEIRAALRVRTLEVAPAVREAFADSTRAEVA